MTTWFVSRHPGAREWAAEEGITVDTLVDHLDLDRIAPGDVVIGSLPVNLAAAVCSGGARYLHLSIDLPLEARGKELSAGDMHRYGARIEAFDVRPERR